MYIRFEGFQGNLPYHLRQQRVIIVYAIQIISLFLFCNIDKHYKFASISSFKKFDHEFRAS